jgi:hypothetical protein
MFRREWSDSVPPRVTAGFAKGPFPTPMAKSWSEYIRYRYCTNTLMRRTP